MLKHKRSSQNSSAPSFITRLRHRTPEACQPENYYPKYVGHLSVNGHAIAADTPPLSERSIDLGDLPDLHDQLLAIAVESCRISATEAAGKRLEIYGKQPAEVQDAIVDLVDQLAHEDNSIA